jgi:hypothetical protein
VIVYTGRQIYTWGIFRLDWGEVNFSLKEKKLSGSPQAGEHLQ